MHLYKCSQRLLIDLTFKGTWSHNKSVILEAVLHYYYYYYLRVNVDVR